MSLFFVQAAKTIVKRIIFCRWNKSLEVFKKKKKKKPAGLMCNTFLICAFVTSGADYCDLFYLAMLPSAWGKNPPASRKAAACFLSKTGQSEPVISIACAGFLGINTSRMSLPSCWKMYLRDLSSHNHCLSQQLFLVIVQLWKCEKQRCTAWSLLCFSILQQRVLRNGLVHAFPFSFFFFFYYPDNILSGKI